MKRAFALGALALGSTLAMATICFAQSTGAAVPIESASDWLIQAAGGWLLLLLSGLGAMLMAWLKSRSSLFNSVFAQSLFDRYNDACKVGVAMLETYFDNKIPTTLEVKNPVVGKVIDYLRASFPDLFKSKTDTEILSAMDARRGTGPATDALMAKNTGPVGPKLLAGEALLDTLHP